MDEINTKILSLGKKYYRKFPVEIGKKHGKIAFYKPCKIGIKQLSVCCNEIMSSIKITLLERSRYHKMSIST